MIKLTVDAANRIKTFLAKEPGKVFRLKLAGGGCSGFEYQVSVTDNEPGDIHHASEGAVIVTDTLSESMLPELVVDYIDTIGFSGFKFENPNAKNNCGCGQSFSL